MGFRRMPNLFKPAGENPVGLSSAIKRIQSDSGAWWKTV